MIESLTIKNYKCFADTTVKMKPLTILCGENGSGKSSAVQALLLMREAALNASIQSFVSLNGPFSLELGTVSDIVSQTAAGEVLQFGVEGSDGKQVSWLFEAKDEYLDNPYLTFFASTNRPADLPACLKEVRTGLFTYLCAERFGPRESLPFQFRPKGKLELGVSGEYVAEVLMQAGRQLVRRELICPGRYQTDKSSLMLEKQLEFWMSELFPGINIRVEACPELSCAAIRVRLAEVTSDWVKPGNMGFGVSHSLPIFVAGLLSEPGGLLIVDSPESHLHPAAQSSIAGFLGVVASAGTQVVLETHSDHILNGIRLGCVRKDHPLSSTDVAIQNFQRDKAGCIATTQIQISPKGSLSVWPQGFLDQTEKDLAAMLHARGAK